MRDIWTIGELAERAADVLGPDSRANGRVRDVPNERLVRWYTTIGLLDPPSARRGRVALYGRRHLLQLVAIKRRQADGMSIAAIQMELAGATDATLDTIARLPTEAPFEAPFEAMETRAANADPPAARDRFWTGTSPVLETHHITRAAAFAAPEHISSEVPQFPQAPEPLERSEHSAAPGSPGQVPASDHAVQALVHGVRLAPGVTLMVDGWHRTPSGDDVATLLEAARPLLAALASLSAAQRQTERPPDHTEGITP